MEDIVLTAEKRTVIGKQVKALRRQGKLPAIIYGHHIQPVAITLDTRETSRLLAGITPSHLITIKVGKENHTVLVREKQRHPVQGVLLHIDFLAVSMTEKLRANVVIDLIGDSPAVKDFDGILVNGVEVVEVECLPKDLPERIQVDISSLHQIGDSLHVRDIQISDAVEILTDPAEMVVLVTAPAVEEIEAAAEATAAEPEVIEKGKKEEEEF
jgi:large subunit ribosomal protein L25